MTIYELARYSAVALFVVGVTLILLIATAGVVAPRFPKVRQ